MIFHWSMPVEMVISRRGIKTDTKMEQTNLCLCFVIRKRNLTSSMRDIKRKINEFHGVDSAANEVIMFGNPCTMQIISKHWTDENLKSPAKPVNAPLIKGIYRGGELQRKSRPDSESYGTCYCGELQRYESTSEKIGDNRYNYRR